MSFAFRYEIGEPVWWARSIVDTRWLIRKRRSTETAARVQIEYYVQAMSDANLAGWAMEADVWSVAEVPES